MGSEISKFLTDYLPNWVYIPALVPPVCFEAQDNYDSKGRRTGKVDEERERLRALHKKSPWKASERIIGEIGESRRRMFLQNNEPHLDHPEPKFELPRAKHLIFPGWDSATTVYLRLVFASLDTNCCGLIRKHHVEGFIRSLGGCTKTKKFQELFDIYDMKGLKSLTLDDFLKFTFYLDRDPEDGPDGKIHRKIKNRAEMSACLTHMNVNDSIPAGFF